MAGKRKRWPRDAAKERFWRRVVERWRRAGISIRAFCRRESLSEPSFHAWRRELRRRDQEKTSVQSQPAFVPVRVAASAPFLELVLAAGQVLRVPPGFDRQTLREVVAALETPSC